MPPPPLLAFAAYKAPHLLPLGGFHLVADNLHWLSLKTLAQACIDLLSACICFFRVLRTVVGLTLKTRAVSRSPLPLRAMSTICGFTAGRQPWFRYSQRKMCRGPSVLVQR